MSYYYEDTEGQLFVDPIVKKHIGLTQITESQFNEKLAQRNKPTTEHLMQRLSAARKAQEKQGVTINGIRYAGNPGNRQALQEAIAFMTDAGLTDFPKWKDSDNQFYVDHPLTAVVHAYRVIGSRRVQLIQKESEYVSQILAGTLTDLSNLTWLSS
jgi:hypothetical protein